MYREQQTAAKAFEALICLYDTCLAFPVPMTCFCVYSTFLSAICEAQLCCSHSCVSRRLYTFNTFCTRFQQLETFCAVCPVRDKCVPLHGRCRKALIFAPTLQKQEEKELINSLCISHCPLFFFIECSRVCFDVVYLVLFGHWILAQQTHSPSARQLSP